jgi:hypothetical protein
VRAISLYRKLRRMKNVIIPPSLLSSQEHHVFGVISPIYGRLRFLPVFDEAEFLHLTWRSELPPLWCCWHEGTTADFPSSIERLPIVTVGIWQHLNTGRQPARWTEELRKPQDPRPLLESYRQYYWASKGLRVVPCTIGEANRYVGNFHRHSRPVQAALFAVQATDATGIVRGVAIVGRPVARLLDVGVDGHMKRRIAEVLRVATDTTWNVSSLLYGAVRRIAKEMGFELLITYTLSEEESGTSLRAAGWTCVEETGGQQWSHASRPRRLDALYSKRKYRWECILNPPFPFEAISQPGNMAEAMPFACHHFLRAAALPQREAAEHAPFQLPLFSQQSPRHAQ